MRIRVLSVRRNRRTGVAVARVEARSVREVAGGCVAVFRGTVRVRAGARYGDDELRELARDRVLAFLDIR